MENDKTEVDNLKLWKAVEKTDPAHTRSVSQRGGYTAICPQYQARVATGQWGSYGRAWGLKNMKFDYTLLDLTRMVILKAEFFYPSGSFQVNNAIEVISAKGYPDSDFAKKLETNTISKALSRLGFSADVFMGEFDDADYVNELNNQIGIDKALDKDAEREKKVKEFNDTMVGYVKQINKALAVHEVKALFNKAFRIADLNNNNPARLRLTQVMEENITRLQGAEDVE